MNISWPRCGMQHYWPFLFLETAPSLTPLVQHPSWHSTSFLSPSFSWLPLWAPSTTHTPWKIWAFLWFSVWLYVTTPNHLFPEDQAHVSNCLIHISISPFSTLYPKWNPPPFLQKQSPAPSFPSFILLISHFQSHPSTPPKFPSFQVPWMAPCFLCILMQSIAITSNVDSHWQYLRTQKILYHNTK